MQIEHIEINNQKYEINIYYDNRKNAKATIGKKQINIRIPKYISNSEKTNIENKLKTWIIKKIQDMQNKGDYFQKDVKKYNTGDIIKLCNKEYILNIVEVKEIQTLGVLSGNIITITISNSLNEIKKNEIISKYINKLIAEDNISWITNKINILNQTYFNQKINKIHLKNNTSNWGSCSITGNINISTRLLQAKEEVINYVCIHELAHLIEHNHSEKFWQIVHNAMPDYKEQIKWLKENNNNFSF
ncbi:MAG TPA: M48 family metallopeptidase [Candidatus Diapherotrites archaeon]|nr:M48 family metallopeptidase [Candidatus Diapherotrites archaeon]